MELTFEQTQEIDKFLEDYKNNPSNSNKYRIGLHANIEQLIASYTAKEVEEEQQKHIEIYRWLLGWGGHFPVSEEGKRYNWRAELRERLPKNILYAINEDALKDKAPKETCLCKMGTSNLYLDESECEIHGSPSIEEQV